MGEAIAGKKLGKKAMAWGILAHSLPDIDVVAFLWLDASANLLAHRGFTHSILFATLMTILLSLLAYRLHRARAIGWSTWGLLFGCALFAHLFIDAFNNYGIGWFEPFSHVRISFNTIYVADPFFSIGPGIACILLLASRKNNHSRRLYGAIGLGSAAVYLGYCLSHKALIDKDMRRALQKQHVPYDPGRYFTTPAPFQNWLWYVVAGNDTGYYIGYSSLFDRGDDIAFHYFPKNDSLLAQFKDRKDVKRLLRFSKGYYTVGLWRDTLVFNDLRFGQILGWERPDNGFVFHYYLEKDADNRIVVQRGRFEGWGPRAITSLWERIKGRNEKNARP